MKKISIFLQIISLLLFITAHFLITIWYHSELIGTDTDIFGGGDITSLLIDSILWLAVIIQLVSIALLLFPKRKQK